MWKHWVQYLPQNNRIINASWIISLSFKLQPCKYLRVTSFNMSILHVISIAFITWYVFFKAIILCQSNNFYYGTARKRSRKISEYLSKSPRKETTTWPSAGIKKVLRNKHISKITEYSSVITPRQNPVEILPFGLCLSIQTDKCYSWYSGYNPL